jgi:hypothetical protein
MFVPAIIDVTPPLFAVIATVDTLDDNAYDALVAKDDVPNNEPVIPLDALINDDDIDPMTDKLPDTNKLPVITALPLYGNPAPLPPLFKAYDAVRAYDELVALLAVPCKEPVNPNDALTIPIIVAEPVKLNEPVIVVLPFKLDEPLTNQLPVTVLFPMIVFEPLMNTLPVIVLVPISVWFPTSVLEPLTLKLPVRVADPVTIKDPVSNNVSMFVVNKVPVLPVIVKALPVIPDVTVNEPVTIELFCEMSPFLATNSFGMIN